MIDVVVRVVCIVISPNIQHIYTGMDNLFVHQLLRLYLCVPGDCVQVIPAYPPGGDTSAGS